MAKKPIEVIELPPVLDTRKKPDSLAEHMYQNGLKTRKKVADYFIEHPDSTRMECAEALQMPYSTVNWAIRTKNKNPGKKPLIFKKKTKKQLEMRINFDEETKTYYKRKILKYYRKEFRPTPTECAKLLGIRYWDVWNLMKEIPREKFFELLPHSKGFSRNTLNSKRSRILVFFAQNKDATKEDCGRELNLSIRTIEKHLRNILEDDV